MKLQKILMPIILLLMVWLMGGCDDFKQKDFKVEGIDAQACGILNDTTLIPIAAGGKDITLFNSSWFGETVYNNVSQIIDSLTSDDSDTNVVRQVITGPNLYNAILPVDTSYLALSSSVDNVVIYATNWIFIRPIRLDGSIVDPASLNISMEMVYECPDLKYRAEFNEVGSTALLQIIKGEQFTGSGSGLLILAN